MAAAKSQNESNSGVRSIQQVVPAEIFFVAGIMDGAGDKSNRLVLRLQGDTKFYFLFAKGVEENMKTPAPWLQRLIADRVGASSANFPKEDVSISLSSNPMEGR